MSYGYAPGADYLRAASLLTTPSVTSLRFQMRGIGVLSLSEPCGIVHSYYVVGGVAPR
jgi:hypothetical protein